MHQYRSPVAYMNNNIAVAYDVYTIYLNHCSCTVTSLEANSTSINIPTCPSTSTMMGSIAAAEAGMLPCYGTPRFFCSRLIDPGRGRVSWTWSTQGARSHPLTTTRQFLWAHIILWHGGVAPLSSAFLAHPKTLVRLFSLFWCSTYIHNMHVIYIYIYT